MGITNKAISTKFLGSTTGAAWRICARVEQHATRLYPMIDWFYASEMRSCRSCQRWSHTFLNSANLHTAWQFLNTDVILIQKVLTNTSHVTSCIVMLKDVTKVSLLQKGQNDRINNIVSVFYGIQFSLNKFELSATIMINSHHRSCGTHLSTSGTTWHKPLSNYWLVLCVGDAKLSLLQEVVTHSTELHKPPYCMTISVHDLFW
jgi:hypothetical protein